MAERPGGRTLREIVRVLATRLLDMAVIFAAVVATTWAATALAPKWYRSEALLAVAGGPAPDRAENRPARGDPGPLLGTEARILTSRTVIAAALMRLEGQDDPEAFRAANARWVRQVADHVEVVLPGADDGPGGWAFTVRVDWPEEPHRAADRQADTEVFAARRARDFLAALIDAYRQRRDAIERRRARRAAELTGLATAPATQGDRPPGRGVVISVLDPPSQPDPEAPRRPILWLNLLLAAGGGLLLALVYAFCADHFDHSIKSMDDAERHLSVPVVASVPKTGGAIRRQEAGAALGDRAGEIYRGLWAAVFYAGRTEGKSLLVCSADRKEGATRTACGLALAGSESAAERIALVDFNLRQPRIHRLLDLPPSPGVAEVLASGTEAGEAARRVNDALDAFCVGRPDGKLLDVLRREAVTRFLDELSRRYDRVIVDAAPVNAFPDARILAGAGTEALLLARAAQTPREAVAQAVKGLRAAGAAVVGLVLNMRTYPIPRFLYRRL
jgi:Mrp family chromosome partitioning ATPase